jgi:hypothetical protein
MFTRPAATSPPCPNPETLGKLLRDELTWAEASSVEQHVGACHGCQQMLQGLVGSLPDPLSPATKPEARAADEEPPGLPGHALVSRIDAGGMGVVWRVRDLEFHRPLAVKVIKSGLCDSPPAVRRFLAEARITGQLAHPSIVPVHAMGRLSDGRLYYTMKLVEGETLAARLRSRPGSAPWQAEMLRVFAQVCQAVAYAHVRGVIHRDLKPGNVMVGAFGEVQVIRQPRSPGRGRGEVVGRRTRG